MKPKAAEFETLDPSQVSDQNEWIGKRRTFRLDLDGQTFQSRFCKLVVQTASTERLIEIQFGQHQAFVYVDDWNQLLTHQEFLGGGTLDDLPDEVASIVIEAVLESVLDQISSVTGPCAVGDFVSHRDLPKIETQFGFHIERPEGWTIKGGIFLGQGMSKLCRKWLAENTPETNTEMDIPVSYPVFTSEVHISQQQLAELKTHDVLLLNKESKSQFLQLGSYVRCHGECNGETFIVDQIVKLQDQESAYGGDQSLTIRLSKGRITTNTSEMQSLSVRQQLQVDDSDRTLLWLGDHCFAEGEFVSFNHHQGVRILNISTIGC